MCGCIQKRSEREKKVTDHNKPCRFFWGIYESNPGNDHDYAEGRLNPWVFEALLS